MGKGRGGVEKSVGKGVGKEAMGWKRVGVGCEREGEGWEREGKGWEKDNRGVGKGDIER